MRPVKEKPRVRIAGCFLEYEGRFLIVHRNPGGRHGGRWGLPAGKVEQGETESEAVRREVYEETGFLIPPEKPEFLQKIVFDFPEKIIDFFVYHSRLESKIKVLLNQRENQAHAWVTGKECYARDDLINGFHTTLERTGYASKDTA